MTPRHHSCAAGCRYYAGDNCAHPKREDHWRVPMPGNCFGFNHDWPPLAEAARDDERAPGAGQLALAFPKKRRRPPSQPPPAAV